MLLKLCKEVVAFDLLSAYPHECNFKQTKF